MLSNFFNEGWYENLNFINNYILLKAKNLEIALILLYVNLDIKPIIKKIGEVKVYVCKKMIMKYKTWSLQGKME